ncbi:energy-coupling factor transporter transmembrane component T family protein [Fodinibius halophilus]|uniref:Energy-coupling factor transporter transmembrane protein EcfT n=1 Tax=Fodinibius halophilus TaxID=1736908 RepID=A0A6M1T5Q6_9BACT|nr:energy-coupling factor transporter transmembrane component T [Fodinibius halophilus]NGP88605.1 energy-coupling factor transporter transmembrane protein EcfT [Fodinibius halophilus]
MLYKKKYSSWLHRINPALKLVLLMGGIIAVLFIHNVNVMIPLVAALAGMLLIGSGQPIGRVLLFMLPFLFVFVSTGSSMILFGKGETLWWQWGPAVISRESFYRGVHIGLRALSFGLIGLLFALTTRPVLLFYSLMQQFRLPPRYAYGFMASLRLLPLILEEFKTLQKAYKVRGVDSVKGWKGWWQKLRLYAIPLLAQSIRRAQRIAVAMEARRFNKSIQRTYYYRPGFSSEDGLMVICWVGIFAGAWIVGVQWPLFEITDVRFNE